MASIAAASATESKLLKRDTMLNDLEDLDPGTLNKVNGRGRSDVKPQIARIARRRVGRTCDPTHTATSLASLHVPGRRQQH